MRFLGRFSFAAALSASIALAQQASQATSSTPAAAAMPAVAVEPDAAFLAWLDTQRDGLGRRCDFKASYVSGELRLLACGEAGVWIVRPQAQGTPLVIERRELDGSVTGFFEHDGSLWVQLSSVHARVLVPQAGSSAQAASSPAVPASSPAESPPSAIQPSAPPKLSPPRSSSPQARTPAHGKVIVREPGVVIINIGADDSVYQGEHVALFENVREDLGGSQYATRRTRLVVGKVISVAPGRARVALGINERVPLGAFAVVTSSRLTAQRAAPPRDAGVWEVGFMARPFLVLENIGVGMFVDANAGYRTEGGLHVEALLAPFVVAVAKQGTAVPFAGLLMAGYDSRLFEVGLGAGGQSLSQPAFDLEPGTALTLAQHLRIGARDGLMLEGLSYVALFHSRFNFAMLRIVGQIPVGETSWLMVGGGGGLLGLGYGEIGLRLLLSGNGDRESFFLTTAVGGLNVFKSWPCLTPAAFIPVNGFNSASTCKQSIDYAGPMLGVGGEWRL